ISAHFTATPGVPVSPTTLQPARTHRTPEVEPRVFTADATSHLRALTPNNSGQRLRPTYYRGCWHVVSRRFFCRYRHFRFFPTERGLQPEGRHPPRGVAASGFRPLCNIPHCCLP